MGRVKTDTRLARERLEAEIAQRRAQTAEHLALAAKAGAEAAVYALIPGTLAWWAHERMGAVLSAEDLRGSSDPLKLLWPGVKMWIADTLGCIVGPVVAAGLPARLHDNGRYLQAKWGSSIGSRYGASFIAEMSADIAREAWFTAAWQPLAPDAPHPLPGEMVFAGFRLSPAVQLLIVLSFAASGVVVVEVTKTVAAKLSGLGS